MWMRHFGKLENLGSRDRLICSERRSETAVYKAHGYGGRKNETTETTLCTISALFTIRYRAVSFLHPLYYEIQLGNIDSPIEMPTVSYLHVKRDTAILGRAALVVIWSRGS
jgi:hypothetical protein